MKTVDVGTVLDEGRWTGYQKLLIAGTALTIILDGVDNQLLPNAIPTLIKEWNVPGSVFATVQATAPFGMLIGAALGGMLGDRFGRRTALLGSVLSFAVVTLAIAFVDGVVMLGILRFLAGIGLGGAMPNAAALASEYVPRQRRSFAVTLTIVCIPLGGGLAAQMASLILPAYGWRPLFVVGGALPILLAAVLFKVLPESPRYLAGRPERWPELTALMRRIGHNVPDDAVYVDASGGAVAKSRASIRQLFVPDFRRDTLGLFGAFFFCLMANYIGFFWIPRMLTGAGFAQVHALNANAVFNYGGVLGAILGALTIQRLGSRITMLGMSALGVASALVMVTMPLNPSEPFRLIAMFAVTGGLLNAVQTTMYALAAQVYPTEIRSTGVGTAVAVGRIGHALASYVGAFALERGGPPGYFSSWVVTMSLVFISLAVVRRHVPGVTSLPANVRTGVQAAR